MSTLETEPEVVEVDEEVKVHDWRLHQLLGLGYSISGAENLLAHHVDYHQVADLMEQGCSRLLAGRILRD